MDKRKVRRFKNQQKRLANKISKAHGNAKYTIFYEQWIPSIYVDPETGKMIIMKKGQYIFPTDVMKKGRNKLFVVIIFEGDCNKKVLGKILRRYFEIKYIDNGFEIRYSFNQNSIATF